MLLGGTLVLIDNVRSIPQQLLQYRKTTRSLSFLALGSIELVIFTDLVNVKWFLIAVKLTIS